MIEHYRLFKKKLYLTPKECEKVNDSNCEKKYTERLSCCIRVFQCFYLICCLLNKNKKLKNVNFIFPTIFFTLNDPI